MTEIRTEGADGERDRRPLLARVPALRDRWLELFTPPTPVRPLRELGGEPGARLWLKDDRFADAAGGGSKSRKLEPLLAAALGSGARSVATFGDEGGSHVLTVARHARAFGLEPIVYVTPQRTASGSFARANARELRRSGVRRVVLPKILRLGWEQALLATRRRAGDSTRSPGGRYLIPGGGSNALGCLGAVNAALELVDQMPEPPDELFVASGSCGLAAGLAVGFALAGAPVRVVAVDASSRWHPSVRRLGRLVHATAAELRRLGCSVATPSPDRWSLERPPGRAEAAATRELALRREGLALDEVYTAPALAACLRRARARPDLAILFWSSCARPDGSSSAVAGASPRDDRR